MLHDLLMEIQADTGSVDPLLAVAEEIDHQASQGSFFQKRNIRINVELYANFAWTAMCVSLSFPVKIATLTSLIQGFTPSHDISTYCPESSTRLFGPQA